MKKLTKSEYKYVEKMFRKHHQWFDYRDLIDQQPEEALMVAKQSEALDMLICAMQVVSLPHNHPILEDFYRGTGELPIA